MKKMIYRMILASLIVVFVMGTLSVAPVTAKQKAPKHIIIMISDGWGYNQVNAASYYRYGEPNMQVYNEFPFQKAMSTFEYEGAPGNFTLYGYDPVLAWSSFGYLKQNATDSASAATAMSTGTKTFNGAIGVDINQEPLKHASAYAEEAGKATGVVTSVEFSHATPAGFVAHNITRNDYAGIANEMIYSSATDVIMGCGAPDYNDSGVPQNPSGKEKYVGGPVTWADITDDGLVTGADADSDGLADMWKVVRARSEFQALAYGETPARVLGIPYVNTTLQQSRSGDRNAAPYVVPLTPTVPTLVEMTMAAINVLDNDPDGFFLMVEGGAVDWAGHANQSGRLIEEQLDFDDAVSAVVAWVEANSNWGETLLIVTGDHETGYLTGPGASSLGYWTPLINNGAGFVPGLEWNSGDHTNNLIPFYAKGDDGRWFNKAVYGFDPVHGNYIDNISIGQIVIMLLSGR